MLYKILFIVGGLHVLIFPHVNPFRMILDAMVLKSSEIAEHTRSHHIAAFCSSLPRHFKLEAGLIQCGTVLSALRP